MQVEICILAPTQARTIGTASNTGPPSWKVSPVFLALVRTEMMEGKANG